MQLAPGLAMPNSRTYKCDIKLILSRQDRPLYRHCMYSCHDAISSRCVNYVWPLILPWSPEGFAATNGEFRLAPTSVKLGWADLRSDNLGSPSDNAHNARLLYNRPPLVMSSDDQGIAALTPPAEHLSGAGSPAEYSSPHYFHSPAAESARRPSNGRSKYMPVLYTYSIPPQI